MWATVVAMSTSRSTMSERPSSCGALTRPTSSVPTPSGAQREGPGRGAGCTRALDDDVRLHRDEVAQLLERGVAAHGQGAGRTEPTGHVKTLGVDVDDRDRAAMLAQAGEDEGADRAGAEHDHVVPGRDPARSTACRPTARGCASAASGSSQPSGMGTRVPTGAATSSASPPWVESPSV